MIFDLVPGELYETVHELRVNVNLTTNVLLEEGDRVVVLSHTFGLHKSPMATVSLLSPKHGKVKATLIFSSNILKGTEVWFKRISTEEEEQV